MSRPLCGSERTDQPRPRRGKGRSSQRYGGHGERETPGLIPNPEAKPLSADGTAPGTGWESRTPPDNHSERGSEPCALAPVRMRVRPLPTHPSPSAPPNGEVPADHDFPT